MQDEMQFVVECDRFPRSKLMFLPRVPCPCRPAYPRNRTEFHKRLGETQQFECVRNSAEEKTRATKEKEAGKTLDFTAIGSRKCDYTGQSCAPERAYAVGGCGRSAPLRVQGHADCGHVRGVKLLGRATRAVFARPRRRAHRETNTLVYSSFVLWIP